MVHLLGGSHEPVVKRKLRPIQDSWNDDSSEHLGYCRRRWAERKGVRSCGAPSCVLSSVRCWVNVCKPRKGRNPISAKSQSEGGAAHLLAAHGCFRGSVEAGLSVRDGRFVRDSEESEKRKRGERVESGAARLRRGAARLS